MNLDAEIGSPFLELGMYDLTPYFKDVFWSVSLTEAIMLNKT